MKTRRWRPLLLGAWIAAALPATAWAQADRPALALAASLPAAAAVTGAGDLWARVVARSNSDLQRVIDQVLADPGVGRSTTVIALAEQVPYRVLPLVSS